MQKATHRDKIHYFHLKFQSFHWPHTFLSPKHHLPYTDTQSNTIQVPHCSYFSNTVVLQRSRGRVLFWGCFYCFPVVSADQGICPQAIYKYSISSASQLPDHTLPTKQDRKWLLSFDFRIKSQAFVKSTYRQLVTMLENKSFPLFTPL